MKNNENIVNENNIQEIIQKKIEESKNVPREVPEEFTRALVKLFLPRMYEFYEDENNMKEYLEWKNGKESEI